MKQVPNLLLMNECIIVLPNEQEEKRETDFSVKRAGQARLQLVIKPFFHRLLCCGCVL